MTHNPLKDKRCLGHCRSSSDPQAEDALPQQLEVLIVNCEVREMIWVGHDEETTSGSDPGNRADIDRLIQRKLTKDDFDVILVQDGARWTRAGQEHAAWLKGEFARHGVKVIFASSNMANTRYSWIEEGFEFEAAHDYVVKLAFNSCRGKRKKVENDEITYTARPPFGIDRLYSNAAGKATHIIRNLQDGRQLKLDPVTRSILEEYPKEQKGKDRRHYRKQESETVTNGIYLGSNSAP